MLLSTNILINGKIINRTIHDLKVKFLGLSLEGCLSTMLRFMVVRKKNVQLQKEA